MEHGVCLPSRRAQVMDGYKHLLYLFELKIVFCFTRNIHACAYDVFSNITFLVHNINVVHENQCMCI
jgi:hypothetical protein